MKREKEKELELAKRNKIHAEIEFMSWVAKKDREKKLEKLKKKKEEEFRKT